MVAPTGPASLVLRREGGTEDVFAGTIRRSKIHPGAARLEVALVGGAGRLLDPLDPLDLPAAVTPLPAGYVLRQLADAAGEQLDDGVEEALEAFTLPRWHRAGGMSAAESVDAFVAELARLTGTEIGWRVPPTGKLWVGVETWTELAHAARPLDPDLDDGAIEYAPDGAPLLAGRTIDGRRIEEVAYVLQPGSLRAIAREAVAGDPPHLPALDLYRATYAAEVKAQRDDGTLDVVCDDARVGALIALPFKLGIPGATATIPEGARIRVRFESASPSGAYACDLDLDDEADRAFALVGDACDAGTLAVAGAGVTLTYTPPGGTPGTPGTTVDLSAIISGPGHRWAKGRRGP